MYRNYLQKSLSCEELKDHNKHAPEGVRYCNGFCQDYRDKSIFSGEKSIKMICNDCRNIIGLAESKIKRKEITLEQVKENPHVVYGLEDKKIGPMKECKTCHVKKSSVQFEHNRRICKACKAIKSSEKRSEGIDTYIKDIETLKTHFSKLREYLKSISRDKLTVIISHFSIGRKSSDNKGTMVENIVKYFEHLADPHICKGGCGLKLIDSGTTCQTCKNRKVPSKKSVPDINIEEIANSSGIIEDHFCNKQKLWALAKKLGVPDIRQLTKKSELLDKVNKFISERSAKEKDREVEILQPINSYTIELNGTIVNARPTDGYVNATELCKAGGKQFRDWHRSKTTKELVTFLEQETKHDVIVSKKGNSNDFTQGSWIHPDLSIQLAQWISPVFAIKVNRWVKEFVLPETVASSKKKNERQLKELQALVHKERSEKEQIVKKHSSLLFKRNYHKLKKGPCFYIISNPTSKEMSYKIGITNNINKRLGHYRTSIPQVKLEFLVYTSDNEFLETGMLKKYSENRQENLNHEWIFDVKLPHLISSITTFLQFCSCDYEIANNDDLEKCKMVDIVPVSLGEI